MHCVRRRGRRLVWIVLGAACLGALLGGGAECRAESPKVRVTGEPGRWALERDGRPYVIRGAGGDGSWELLARSGGNSVRTWGAERLGEQLDAAHRLGLTVVAGIWLGQVRQGFDWSDADGLRKQRDAVRAVIERHKDHPALLLWALGNEMEDDAGKQASVWNEINQLARIVKSIDDRHPTMTVIAEIGGDKVRNFHTFCPDVDLLGINSYAGAATLGERYRRAGGVKPYLLTEFGPPGIWEIQKDEIGAYRELSSGLKAEAYRTAYRRAVLDQPGLCLGSFAFLWGGKQEVTATWFSLLTPDGSRLEAVDALSELWTGRAPADRCPRIESLTLASAADGRAAASLRAPPGAVVRAALSASDPEGRPLRTTWRLLADDEEYGTGGDAEAAAADYSRAIFKANGGEAELQAPAEGGLYRLFAFVHDEQGGAAVANAALRVDGPARLATGRRATLPLTIYDEASDEAPYAPSGWMGDVKSIKLDPADARGPHNGKTSLRCEFSANQGWGGVAWQHPPSDWGDRRGGYDLRGAKRIVFFARGAAGGEEVTFQFGLIGREKRYHDSAKRSTAPLKLTAEWRRYEIPIGTLNDGESLERIKTGFAWTVASPGRPVVFYLDDVRWE